MRLFLLVLVAGSGLATEDCPAAGDPCANGGDYWPDPCDCFKFYRCASGGTFLFTCAAGTSFHADTRRCDFTDLSKCYHLPAPTQAPTQPPTPRATPSTPKAVPTTPKAVPSTPKATPSPTHPYPLLTDPPLVGGNRPLGRTRATESPIYVDLF